MLITGDIAAKPTGNDYTAAQYGPGWYGANAARRYQAASVNGFDIRTGHYNSVRFHPIDGNVPDRLEQQAPDTYWTNLTAFARETMAQLAKQCNWADPERLPVTLLTKLEQEQQETTLADKRKQAEALFLEGLRQQFRSDPKLRALYDEDDERIERVLNSDAFNQFAAPHLDAARLEWSKDTPRHLEQLQRRYALMDTQGDGVITVDEMAAYQRLSDGLIPYIKQFDPGYLKGDTFRSGMRLLKHNLKKPINQHERKHPVDLTMKPDGKISYGERFMLTKYLLNSPDEPLRTMLSHIREEIPATVLTSGAPPRRDL